MNLIAPLLLRSVIALATTVGVASAVDIGFEPPNYSPLGGEDDMGVLARQGNEPPPHSGMEVGCDPGEAGCWRNEFVPDGYRVAAGVGLQGSQGIVNSGGDFYKYVYETDDATLDFSGGATFDNTSSILYYDLAFKLDNVRANDAVNTQAFSFGVFGATSSDVVMELIVQDKNALGILHGNGDTFTSSFNQAANDPMRAPGEWQTLSGAINYATQTFTVVINDITWSYENPTVTDNGGNYSFRSLLFGDPDLVTFSIDGANIKLTADNRQAAFFDPDLTIDDVGLTSIAPPTLGDYDGNGSVGIEDYNLWVSTFGSTVVLDADGNGNNIVDIGDYNVWRDNAPAVLPALAVPEPTAVAVLALAMPAVLLARRSRG